MAMTMQYCPYCSGAVVAGEDLYDLCDSCGKRLYKYRSDFEQFPAVVGNVEKYSPVIAMIKDDNLPKAFETVQAMIEDSSGEDPDELMLLGCIYMQMGEDGKALAEWRKSIEKLETFQNFDAYVCTMSAMISDHIYYIETEFVNFDYIKYIDRLGEILYDRLKEPCTYVLYLTINRIYRRKLRDLGVTIEDPVFCDVLSNLFCRIIEYNRNCEIVDYLVTSMLQLMGYDEATYVEDENILCHTFALFRDYVSAYMQEMTEEDKAAVRHYWNDENMKELVTAFEGIIGQTRGESVGLGLFRRKSDDFDLAGSVNAYVRKYLLISAPSKDAQSD